METIVIPNISENPENWKILRQCAFSSFCKTSLILSELLQFKSIWCPSGKNFAFSSNPPCKLQASEFSFVSFLLVLHSPFTRIFYNTEDQMLCYAVKFTLYCLFLQKECPWWYTENKGTLRKLWSPTTRTFVMR